MQVIKDAKDLMPSPLGGGAGSGGGKKRPPVTGDKPGGNNPLPNPYGNDSWDQPRQIGKIDPRQQMLFKSSRNQHFGLGSTDHSYR